MPDKFLFRYTPIPKGSKPITGEEWEKIALGRLEHCEMALKEAVWEVIRMYCKTDRQQNAMSYVDRVLAEADDPEEKARCYLTMGCIMEQIDDFSSAISYYSQALHLEPISDSTWYFIHNNIGFCLNHFGRCKEAEPYCRKAIEIDPGRYNAKKNLAISLEGQGHYAAAARCYIEAVRSEASDPRALRHLESLLESHPEIRSQIPEISDQLEGCRNAVTAVEREYEKRLKEARRKRKIPTDRGALL